MKYSTLKPSYMPPEMSEDCLLLSALLAESNTEPISDDDNDIVW